MVKIFYRKDGICLVNKEKEKKGIIIGKNPLAYSRIVKHKNDYLDQANKEYLKSDYKGGKFYFLMARTLWMDALNMRERELNVELRKKLTEIGDKVWKNPKKPTKFYGYAPPHIGKEKRYKYINAKGSVLKSGFKYWDDAHEYGMKHDGDRFGLPKGKVVRYYLAKKVKVKKNPIPKLKIEKSLETDEYVVKKYTDKGYVPIYRSMRYFDAKDHLDKLSGGYMRVEKKVVKNGYVIELFTYKDGWIPIAELSSKDEAEKYIKKHKSDLISKHSPELISILSRKTKKHWTVYDKKKNPVIKTNPKTKKEIFAEIKTDVEVAITAWKIKNKDSAEFNRIMAFGKYMALEWKERSEFVNKYNDVYILMILEAKGWKKTEVDSARRILLKGMIPSKKKNPVYYKCMLCGRYHKDGSKILKRHIHEYYKKGGTIELSRWERKESKKNPVYIEKRYDLIPFIQKNPDPVDFPLNPFNSMPSTPYCVKCSSKHLGSARVNFIEALSTNDSDRQKKKLLGVMDELAEGEKHLIKQKPEAAVEIRNIRKEIEKMVFNKNSNDPVITPENIESLRWKIVKEVN